MTITIPYWQPISTAPKDGFAILLNGRIGKTDTITSITGFWSIGDKQWFVLNGNWPEVCIHAINWSPLPIHNKENDKMTIADTAHIAAKRLPISDKEILRNAKPMPASTIRDLPTIDSDLRRRFAIAALTGLCNVPFLNPESVAERAFEIANCMLKENDK